LILEGASGNRVIKGIRATANAGDIGKCDLYIIATKASGVEAAARAISSLKDSESIVLTIQNGLGAGDRIARYMNVENVLLGVADGFGASIRGPGQAHHNAMNLIRIGEMSGGMTDRLKTITKVWQDAGFIARAFDDIDQLIWGKYISNVSFSGPCTVFDCTLGELMKNPDTKNIAEGCAREVYLLGLARGIKWTFNDTDEYIAAFAAKMPDARPSMLLDHHANRPSEIDAINGMAVELGKQLDIPTPYNEVLSAVIRLREKRF
ncbi:MAG: 2-dehydropantoate 2-reductase, partial [Proteobacteria bacterium]|nr:2-dehydropantoate 2-reductase [Pseudomonadota bacterium]